MTVIKKESIIEESEHIFLQSPELLFSITSLHHKSNQNSKFGLFRSDSINKKKMEVERIEVEIKQKKSTILDLTASI